MWLMFKHPTKLGYASIAGDLLTNRISLLAYPSCIKESDFCALNLELNTRLHPDEPTQF